MGADQFSHRVPRDGTFASPGEAFDALTSEARYMSGHGGYTGTIGEKHDFLLVRLPADFGTSDEVMGFLEDHGERWDQETKSWVTVDPAGNRLRAVLGQREFDRWRETYNDKWGPALCIQTEHAWLFCGYASS